MRKRLVTIVIMLVIIISYLPVYVNAAKAGSAEIVEIPDGESSVSGGSKTDGSSSGSKKEEFGLGDLDNYKGTVKTPKKAKAKVEIMLGYIQVVGMVLSVIILILIGFKYMLGSIEEKAEYKKTLIPYIIGAFILFTGSTIPNIIYKFAQNL